jgi:hypothetical protein
MKSEIETLEAEVLEGIQPFSGLPVKASGRDVTEQVILSGGAMQQTKTAYTTAVTVQQPRSIAKIANNVLEEARLAGKSFYYRWTTKNKDGSKGVVEGPSIDMAMALCRHYGNCVVDVEATETSSHYMMKGLFIDLESGFTCPRLFRQRKNQGTGMKDKDRQEDIIFQIGQSKAIRNAVVKAMPEWLIEKAIEVATEAELNKAKKENIHLARQKVIEFFSQYGVSADRIEAERKRPVDQWTPDDIVDLRGMATALKEGRASGEELFPPVTKAEAEPEKELSKKTASSKSEAPAKESTKEEPAGLVTQPDLPKQKKTQPEPEELSPEEAAVIKKYMVAAKGFPQEAAQAKRERGITEGMEISAEDAKWLLVRMNRILDEKF